MMNNPAKLKNIADSNNKKKNRQLCISSEKICQLLLNSIWKISQLKANKRWLLVEQQKASTICENMIGGRTKRNYVSSTINAHGDHELWLMMLALILSLNLDSRDRVETNIITSSNLCLPTKQINIIHQINK